jgi:hypothetical protein
VITYNVIFETMELSSPYLWRKGESSKPLVEDLGVTHHGRSETVNRALTDFGIEDSFAKASKRFEEHYRFKVSPTTADRVTKASALEAISFLEQRLGEGKGTAEQISKGNGLNEAMLVELDGCEIRTGVFAPAEYHAEADQPNRKKILRWRDVRVGLARPVSSESEL